MIIGRINATGTTSQTSTGKGVVPRINTGSALQAPTSTPVQITPTQKKIDLKQIGSNAISTISSTIKKNAPLIVKGLSFAVSAVQNPGGTIVKAIKDSQPVKYPTQEPIQITPDQKKIDPQQLSGSKIIPSTISQSPKPTVWNKITNWLNENFGVSKDKQVALAQNAYAVQKTVPLAKNIPLTELAKPGGNIFKNSPMEEITKELGIRGVPTNSELTSTFMTLALGLGLAEAPLATIKAVGIFTGVNKVKSNFIAALTGKPLGLGADQTLSDLVPNANPTIKNLLDVVDFLGTGALTHQLYTKSPALFDKLTQDTLTKYNLPKTVELNPKTIKDIFKGLSSKEQTDLFTSLNLSHEEIVNLAKSGKGITISVPAEKIVTIVDKPYWAKIKEIFGKNASEPSSTTYSNGQKTSNQTLAGFLEPGEHTSQEIIGKIIGGGLEKTPEGKQIIKLATEAQSNGQNIVVDKVVKEVAKSNASQAGLYDQKSVQNILDKNSKNFESQMATSKSVEKLTPAEIKVRDELFAYTSKPEVVAKYEAGAKDPEIIKDFLAQRSVAQQPLSAPKAKSPQITAKEALPSPTRAVSPSQAQKEVSPIEKFKSRVFERLKADNSQLEGSVYYDPTTIKKEIDKGVKLIAEDKQKAFDIAMRKENATEAESVATNIALAEKALDEGNNELYSKLISNRSIAQSMRGQAIAIEKASVTDNSTAKYVKDLIDTRLKDVGKKYLSGLREGKTTDAQHATKVIERKVAELENKVKNNKLDVKSALKLLDQLECIT